MRSCVSGFLGLDGRRRDLIGLRAPSSLLAHGAAFLAPGWKTREAAKPPCGHQRGPTFLTLVHEPGPRRSLAALAPSPRA